MAQVQGHCDPRFEHLRALFQQNLDDGVDLGASLHIVMNGRPVVDLWGGFADPAKTHPWTENTIVNVYSTTKTIASLALLILIDRGLVDVNAPVSKYWPEFAQNGKEKILVRHILSHTSGICGWEEQLTHADMSDVKRVTTLLEEQAPWFEPGTKLGYQMWTMGFLIGEIVRRVTGLSLTEFVDKEIAGPLGADFQIGAKEKDWDRVATMIPPPPLTDPLAHPPPTDSMDKNSLVYKTFTNPPQDASYSNTSAWRLAEIGAANGHGSAKGIATILSHFITQGGQADQPTTNPLPRPLSPETLSLIFQAQITSNDEVIGYKMKLGVGFGLRGDGTTIADSFLPPGDRICYWGGWGGSWASMDLDRGVTIVFVMNKMANVGLGGKAAPEFVKAVSATLGVEVK